VEVSIALYKSQRIGTNCTSVMMVVVLVLIRIIGL
jgi:hypothetical protein